jgi:hypothetical protein
MINNTVSRKILIPKVYLWFVVNQSVFAFDQLRLSIPLPLVI